MDQSLRPSRVVSILPVVGNPGISENELYEIGEARLCTHIIGENYDAPLALLKAHDSVRSLFVDHRTVKKFRNAEAYPETALRVRQSIVDDYAAYLDQRLGEGCGSSTRLWRELRRQGFSGQVNSVRYWLRQRRSNKPRVPGTPSRPALRASPRQVVWFMLKDTPSAKDFLEKVYRASPEIARIAQLAHDFFRIIRERNLPALMPWIEAAKRTALTGFASRLERDLEAASAALTLPWSQGHVEGQVHRLKLIKRQMHGRAGFDLLRLRVLHQA